LLASLALVSTAQAQTPLDAYLTHLKTLRAEFAQTVTDGKGVEVQKAQGTLVIVRPGRFRWELTPDGSSELRHFAHGGQTIQPRHEGIMQGGRNRQVEGRFAERSYGFDHALGQLLDKQGHTISLGNDLLYQLRRQGLIAYHLFHHLPDLGAI
jgi:hypothetical protein